MSLFDQGITSFAVFEDANEFVGMAQVVLPNLAAVTQELKGAGLAGSIEAIYPGQFQAMTMSMNFNSPSKQSLKLATPVRHTLELRLAVQTEDTVEGTVGTQAQKHVVVVVPKGLHRRDRGTGIHHRRLRRVCCAVLGLLHRRGEIPGNRPHELHRCN